MTQSSRAIALSLQEHTESSSGPITLNEDEALFQQQLQHAIEISKANVQRGELAQSSASTNTFLSERAQLEKERRERQKRLRKAQGLPDSDDDLRAVSDEEDLGQPNAKSSKLGPSQGSFFWDGEWHCQKFWAIDIAFAILSSFALDIPWIYSLFDPSSPVIVVAQPDSNGKASVKNALPNWIKTTPFLRGGYGCMHMKFMLVCIAMHRSPAGSRLYRKSHTVRLAGHRKYLPPLPKEAPFNRQDNESFPSVMKRVLDAVNVLPALSTMLKQDHPNLPIKTTEQICTRWDWSNVKVNLVPSIAGKHEGWPNVILTGHVRLMKAVRYMGFRTGKGSKEKTLELECQGSSIGSYTTQWINEFYHSAKGESAEDWLDKPKSRREKLPYPVEVKVLFPTLATIRSSQHGERGGGNLFFQRSYWEGKKFPRQLFYDSRSKAGKTLMHTKMIVGSISQKVATKGPQKEVINIDTDSEDSDSGEEVEVVDANVGWIYLGSHNFTPSAWGTLSGSAFNPIMNIRNYELGIVLPLKDMAEVDNLACFERPPRKYGPDDSPWIQEESIYFKPRSS
ncbi:phospholipase D nuclease [Lentinula edodes]|uniref:Phospholipase D nuclease n=1 Tax=Lentinula edodes TaxID=5353 RepID=A0A1Q3EFK1_LENED|nr:phospholipase D nuclease [Lentinula edodes]